MEMRKSADIKHHRLHLCILLCIGTLIISGNYMRANRFIAPLRSGGDTSVHSAMIRRINDPTLYQKDIFFNHVFERYPKSFPFLMAKLTALFRDIRFTYVLTTFLAALLCATGLYFLSYKLTGERSVGVIVGILSLVFTKKGFGAEWGWGNYILIPRLLIIAIAPFLFLLFLRWYNSRKLIIVFFAIGMLANINPISALHLAVIFGLTLIFIDRSTKTVKIMPLLCLASAVGALPLLINLVPSIAQGAVDVPSEISNYRVRSSIIAPGQAVIIGVDMITLLLAGLLGSSAKRKRGLTKYDSILRYFVISTLVIVLSHLMTMVGIKAHVFRPLRAIKYLYLYGYIYGACAVTYLLKQKSLLKKACAVSIAVILCLPAGLIARRTLISLKPYFVSQGNVDSNQEDADKYEEHRVNLGGDWDSFYDLAGWCSLYTGKDALFLVPPRGFSIFRTYSKRGIVVSWKDGAQAVALPSGRSAELWYDTYKHVSELYTKNEATLFLDAAGEYKADYIIVDKSKNHMTLPVCYQNSRYCVYRLAFH